jgi:DDE family transposase
MQLPSREILERMPLAEAVLTLWSWAADENHLGQIFERHRGRCYPKILSFAFLVYLIRDALLEYGGSGHKSFTKARERDELKTSFYAAYGKFGRTPIAVSMALLSGCTARLAQAFPEAAAAHTPLPKSLDGYHVIGLDGKAIKRVAKRLKPLRKAAGGLLGGRALVAMNVRSGLAVAMHAHPDGDANDTRFVGNLVPKVRALIVGPRLWMADSGLCDLTQTAHFTSDPSDAFLVRYHPKVRFDVDPSRTARNGTNRLGQRYREDWGWLGIPKNKNRRYVRRITLIRPGEDDVILVTSLLDAAAFPAEDLLGCYLKRWTIENMFQQVTEVFGLTHLIATTPKGTIFQFTLCLLLYNLIQVVRGIIAAGSGHHKDEISAENLFDDAKRELIAWSVVIEPEATAAYFDGEWSAFRVKARLSELLSGLWREGWRKAPPKKRSRAEKAEQHRTHGSVFRILEAHRRKVNEEAHRRRVTEERAARAQAQRC